MYQIQRVPSRITYIARILDPNRLRVAFGQGTLLPETSGRKFCPADLFAYPQCRHLALSGSASLMTFEPGLPTRNPILYSFCCFASRNFCVSSSGRCTIAC
ncbi:hypothetical protein CEXT_408991 [Caerostris extrusa]|uniref:Uncharacterized protein n=1 Tax=Caerostris extrusa TaxID=172846 RepID=A0AAV4WA68_CAEEX|nr:hypothetical protein CEXT_408991 [Caerostris extrusa]